MRHSPGFISHSRNLSCLATMCPLLPVIGRVSGGFWWLTDWASEAQSRVSCPVRVRWFLAYDQDADLFWCVGPGIYTQVYPAWTCGARTPNRGGALQHPRGLNPWPRVQQPSIHCTLAPEGFEPLTKGSWATRLTNCTLWRTWRCCGRLRQKVLLQQVEVSSRQQWRCVLRGYLCW